MKRSLQDWANLAGIIGNVAIILSLVFVGLQIRQNTFQLEQSTMTAKAAAVSVSNAALRETRKSLFESTEVLEIYLRGNETPKELDEASLFRYRLIMSNIMEVLVDIHTQTWMTGFSPETWTTQGVTVLERIFSTKGGQWFWANYADNYPAPFRNEVDRIVQNLSPEPQ